MKSSLLSSFFLLIVAMLLVSACRTAHSVAKEESATQTCDTSHTSVVAESSFASLFSGLSLRADSIVMWMRHSDADGATTFVEEDSCIAPDDTVFSASQSGCTAQSSASAKRNTPQVSKILISGLHLESVRNEQKATSAMARDSLSAGESHVSSLSESEESEPPNNNVWSLIFAFLLIGGIAVFAFLGLRSVLRIK